VQQDTENIGAGAAMESLLPQQACGNDEWNALPKHKMQACKRSKIPAIRPPTAIPRRAFRLLERVPNGQAFPSDRAVESSIIRWPRFHLDVRGPEARSERVLNCCEKEEGIYREALMSELKLRFPAFVVALAGVATISARPMITNITTPYRRCARSVTVKNACTAIVAA